MLLRLPAHISKNLLTFNTSIAGSYKGSHLCLKWALPLSQFHPCLNKATQIGACLALCPLGVAPTWLIHVNAGIYAFPDLCEEKYSHRRSNTNGCDFRWEVIQYHQVYFWQCPGNMLRMSLTSHPSSLKTQRVTAPSWWPPSETFTQNLKSWSM